MKNDDLQIYRGSDFIVADNIIIHQPTLNEICDYGERDYYSMIHTLTSTPQDLKFQLFDLGIDYTTIGNFELFYNLLIKNLTKEQTSIIFGDLDFQKFEIFINNENNETVLYQKVEEEPISHNICSGNRFVQYFKSLIPNKFKKKKCIKVSTDVMIDEYTYDVITDTLRKMHLLKKNEQMPANESTKMILIEDARDEYEANKRKEYHSQLKNLVSAMINSEGFKYNHNEVWQMKINAFLDSVQRVSKIKNAGLLLQSGYSGYGINLKNIDKKETDWLGELE